MQLSAEKIWQLAQEHLRSRLGKDTYNMWFAPLHACDMDAGHLFLETPNEFSEVWLKDNYISLLQDAVAIAAGHQMQIRFKVMAASSAPAPVA
ncbi:MAG TPA: DnaA N-terminal domain-containing protein, partial [Verrucomicrobiae bacterium]|nr:DnaA N-terminal domain-containing protein [Verrucomicrobiae bacterium]